MVNYFYLGAFALLTVFRIFNIKRSRFRMRVMNKYIRLLTLVPIFCFSSSGYTHDLEAAIASNERTPSYASRDEYRNPYETLTFFEIKSRYEGR